MYVHELSLKHYSIVISGLSYLLMDIFNEIFNTIIYYWKGCGLWETPNDSSLLILPGWNIEIIMMFSVAGLTFAKMVSITTNKLTRYLLCLIMSIFCVSIELFLNYHNILVWKWPFWNHTTFLTILIFGYLHFFIVSATDYSKLINVYG